MSGVARASLPRDQLLLFGVMLTIAIGNTGLQSVLPAIGRTLAVPDTVIALTFSLSALVWVIAAPMWARRLERTGAKPMVLLGLIGFTLSLLVCGVALSAGVLGIVPTWIAFAGFVAGRCIYGGLGAAAPPAAQALVAADSSRADRTRALALLASAFGLGTIVGPALAPFFLLPAIGLAGPPFVFAVFGCGMVAVVMAYLPAAAGRSERGVASADTGIGGGPGDAGVIAMPAVGVAVRFGDPRIRAWMVTGLISGHAQAIAGQVMGFLVIDRMGIAPAAAQPLIGLVLMAGAGATLLAQWGVIPRLDPAPERLVTWGAGVAALGCLWIAFARDLHMLAVAYAIASFGFGFLRPGFTAGASLAVAEHEQGSVAGRVTANSGLAFVFAPAAGVLMYGIWRPLPYLASAVALLFLLPYAWRAFRGGSRQP